MLKHTQRSFGEVKVCEIIYAIIFLLSLVLSIGLVSNANAVDTTAISSLNNSYKICAPGLVANGASYNAPSSGYNCNQSGLSNYNAQGQCNAGDVAIGTAFSNSSSWGTASNACFVICQNYQISSSSTNCH